MSELWKYFRDVLAWPLLHAPGPLQAVVKGLALTMDGTRDDIVYLRRQFFPSLCEGELTAAHGESRGIVRHPRETADQYRQRVVKAYRWHQLGGKTLGLPQILRFYGFDIVCIENMRDSNPSRWAEFALELQTPTSDAGYADIVSTLESLIWLVNEYKPARSRLFRIYTGEYDRRPIVLSEGPILGDGWLSYYSGVPVSSGDGNEVLASLGATRRVQAEAYLSSDTDASFGIENGIGNLAPYLDSFVLGRSSLSDRVTRNNPFVVGAMVSFLWAERQTVARAWSGEWDDRRWSDVTGFDRKLPRWRMPHRSISRSQLVPAESSLSNNNARLGATFAVVIDNPGRLGGFALSDHDCGRRELRLHELVIVPSGLATPAVEPQAPQSAACVWLASALPTPNPKRVQRASQSDLSLELERPTWEPPETAGTTLLSLNGPALEPVQPVSAGASRLCAASEPLPEIIPEQASQQESVLLLASSTWEQPEAAGAALLSSKVESVEPPEPSAAVVSYQAPLWSGTWATSRNWSISPQLSIQ